MLFPPDAAGIRPPQRLARVAALAWTVLALNYSPSHAGLGAWTDVQDLDSSTNQDLAIHLVLLRGDGGAPYHSRVVWIGHSELAGGELGWVPGNDDCAAPPLSTFTALGGWSPGANNFCSGLTQLATGELLTVGGSDSGTGWGIRDTRIFTAGVGGGAGSWAGRASMRYARFYPTATVLRDGRVLSSWGQQSKHVWIYGGRRDGNPPGGPEGDLLHRIGRGIRSAWDLPVTPLTTQPGVDPDPREGHASAPLSVGTPAIARAAIFGGRGTDGTTVGREVWILNREEPANPLAGDYDYRWDQVPITGPDRPAARAEHVAVGLTSSSGASTTEMVILGGLRKPTSGSPEEVRSDFWHLRRVGDNWVWDQVLVDSGTPPTGRYGHAAVFHRSSAGVRRMYVFGGSEQVGQDPTDGNVYEFTFTHTSGNVARGTWSTLTPNGTPPSARRDHTMVIDLNAPTDPALLVYGGHVNATTEDATLYRLDLPAGGTATWSLLPTSGPSPGPRAGHSASYELLSSFHGGRMFIFGGDRATPTSPDPDRYFYSIEPFDPAGAVWTRSDDPFPVRLAGHTAIHDPATVTPMARRSEIYDPTSDSWLDAGDGWERVNGNYPVHFVVPGAAPPGGGRVLAVGPDSLARILDVPPSGPPLQGWQPANNGINHDSGFRPLTGVMYAPGKVVIAGGEQFNPETGGWEVVGTTKTMDVSGTGGWQASGVTHPLLPRFHHNLVLLPSGEVLALGGTTTASTISVDGVHEPQIWNPSSGQWTNTESQEALTADPAVRNYHSAALLLPDGRVLSGGGNDNPTFQETVNIFCPPYLFNGPRPVIDWVTAGDITYGQVFDIGVQNAASISSVCLMRPGATTHSFDQSQRYVPLEFALGSPSTLRAVAPTSGALAPPGDYLLFILNQDGVPAIAEWVRLGTCPSTPCDTDSPPPVTTLAPDVVGPNEVWMVWYAPGDDQSPLVGEYDLRLAGAITSAWDYDGAGAAAGEPEVEPAGVPVNFVIYLPPCTQYDFALKTRDGAGPSFRNWSRMSNIARVPTFCGGGGGTFSATGTPSEDGIAPWVAAAEARAASPAAGASVEAGAGVLVAETQRTPERGWQVTLRRLAEVEGVAAADAGAIVSQVPDGRGGWQTLGRSRPSPGQSPLGLCALRSEGRMVIPSGYALDRVVSGLQVGGQALSLGGATHSRLGSLGAAWVDGGGSVDLALGDVVTLDYASGGAALPGAAPWYLVVRASEGAESATPARRALADRVPTRFALHPNQPNPFGQSTSLTFALPVASAVTIEVFDLLGRRVATLAQGEYPAGTHTVEWDLRGGGTPVRPGVYGCRMQAGAFTAKRKLSVLP